MALHCLYIGDPTQAEKYMEAAATSVPNFPRGMFALGSLLVNVGRYPEAEAWYRKAEKSGDPRGIVNLAYLILGGMLARTENGIALDVKSSDQYVLAVFQEAILRDRNPRAMFCLALMYFTGRGGLPRDDVQVLYWLDEACKESLLSSAEDADLPLTTLLYTQGTIKSQLNDLKGAKAALQAAADLGHLEAQKELERLSLEVNLVPEGP
jgi:TPR repeat protein